MKRAILTGFGPFGNYQYNPTQVLALEYHSEIIDNVEVNSLILPCTYYGSFGNLTDVVRKVKPDIILSMGLASRVQMIRLETKGKNLMNGKYPDNNGVMMFNHKVLEKGEPFYETNADNDRLRDALSAQGIPSEISSDAEGFFCNSFIYLTARFIKVNNFPIKFAFMHIPWTDDYLGKVQIEPGKVTVKKQDVKKAIETILAELGRQS